MVAHRLNICESVTSVGSQKGWRLEEDMVAMQTATQNSLEWEEVVPKKFQKHSGEDVTQQQRRLIN